jgi:triosephosphate isomerase
MNQDHLQAIDTVQKLAWALKDAGHDHSQVEAAVIPPFTALRSVQTLVDGDNLEVKYGAQDVSAQSSGAYTGEISAGMLAKLGCAYAVMGHSERRQYHHEDDALVAAKAKAALDSGLIPVICLGEELDVRKEGRQVEHCLSQLDGSLAGLTAEQVAGSVIAYEPVWAIGAGEVATPADAQEVIGALRERISETLGADTAQAVRILYGGSVKSSNVAEIMAEEDVDGALVGGASLDPTEFAAIVRYQSHVKG